MEIAEDDSISNRSTNDSLPVTSRSTLYADIICDGDVEFYNINPSNWQTRQEDVINDVAVIYDSQMNIDLDSVKHETWTSGGPLTSTDAHTLLNQTREYWRTRPEQRDLVHLFTGKNLDGGTIGGAWRATIGTDHAYSLTQQIAEDSDYQATPYHKKVLAAHEIGYNFNGVHGHAVRWRVWPAGEWHYSIMWETFHGDSMDDRYSDGTIHPLKNNVYRIRTHAEAHL